MHFIPVLPNRLPSFHLDLWVKVTCKMQGMFYFAEGAVLQGFFPEHLFSAPHPPDPFITHCLLPAPGLERNFLCCKSGTGWKGAGWASSLGTVLSPLSNKTPSFLTTLGCALGGSPEILGRREAQLPTEAPCSVTNPFRASPPLPLHISPTHLPVLPVIPTQAN